MKIQPFETEDFYARYEFSARHLLSNSDCETTSVAELLELGGSSLDAFGATTLGYTESRGRPELREAIAAGHDDVDTDDVLVVNAPIEGIFVAMSGLLNVGDRAVVLAPCYDALRNIPAHVCENVEMWNLVLDDTGWALDFDRLESLLEPPTKLLVVNFPHNPTGYLPSRDELTRLAELADQRGVWLFCDEIYRGLEPEGTPSLPSAASLSERTIVLGGLSKAYGLPGLRSGWIVVRDDELRDSLLNWKYYTSICPPAPIEALSLAAFSARETLIGRNRQRVADNLERAEPFFARFGDLFDFHPPIAGPVALVGVDVPSATEYCHTLARDAGVVLLPSSFLSYDDRHVRFGFGRDGFAAGLQHYQSHLEATR